MYIFKQYLFTELKYRFSLIGSLFENINRKKKEFNN